MKRVFPILLLVLTQVITGCTSVERVTYDDIKRSPTARIDVYKGGTTPDRKHKQIADLLLPGHREDAMLRQKQLMNEAKRLGGDGLIFSAEPTGGANIFGAAGWVFKGKVIVYE